MLKSLGRLSNTALNDNPPCEREAKLYGGQAVIEGVMMKGPTKAVVSVRSPEGEIVSHTIQEWPEKKGFNWKRLAFIRGIFVLFESLTLGMAALRFSSKVAIPEDEEEINPLLENAIFAFSIVLAIGLFVIFPTKLPEWIGMKTHGETLAPMEIRSILLNLFEGIIRLAIFFGYIVAISMMKEIRRVFQYHGAEHKTVNAYEAGIQMTVENVKKFSTAHFRCGTSFIFIVAVIHILLASLFGWPTIWVRIATRLLILFPVAAISYELLRWSAKYRNNPISRIFFFPGILFQRITSLEPDDDMVEVAINAFKQVIPTEEPQDNPQNAVIVTN